MSRCSDFNYCLCLFRHGVRFPWTLIKIFFWESKLKIKLNPFFGIFVDNKNCKFLTAKNTSTTFRSKDLEASWNSYFRCLYVCLFVCVFVCLFICLSVCLFVCLRTIFRSFYSQIFLSFCDSENLLTFLYVQYSVIAAAAANTQ